MPVIRSGLGWLLASSMMVGCGQDLPTEASSRIQPSSLMSCSVRAANQVPGYAAVSSTLPLHAFFPCNSTVSLVDPSGNGVLAGAAGAMRQAFANTGVPVIDVGLSSPNYTVKVGFTGGTSGPWSGVVTYANGRPDSINFHGSCTNSCGSLVDVALNELTQLYGMADGSGSKWDGFAESGVSDHCAAVGPAIKAVEGSICRFEIEAVWWKYGLIEAIGPRTKHIITGFVSPEVTFQTYDPLQWYYWVGSGYEAGLHIRGIGDEELGVTGFRPEFDYGHPSVGGCQGVQCGGGTGSSLSYTWSVGSNGPTWDREWLEDQLVGQTDDSTVTVQHWWQPARLLHSVGVGASAVVSSYAEIPGELAIFAEPTRMGGGYGVSSFGAEACSEHFYGGKWYARWNVAWSTSLLDPEWGWRIIESPSSDPGDGVTVAQGSSGYSAVLPDYLMNFGSNVRYFFIRYEAESESVEWKELMNNALDVAACAL